MSASAGPAARQGRAPARSWWILRPVLRPIVPFAVLILVWHLAGASGLMSASVLPPPASVYAEFVHVVRAGILPDYVVVSIGRWLVGSAVGLVLGVALAFLMANFRPLRLLLLPVVRFFSATAELSFLPLLILWFGFGTPAMIALIAYSVVFPVVNNTMRAIETVPASFVAAVRTLGGTRLDIARHVTFPGAVAGMVTGFRIGAGYAFRALIAAEIFASSSGLGYMVFQSRETLNVSRMLVGMTAIGLIWLFVDRVYLRPVEVATIRRWGLERDQ